MRCRELEMLEWMYYVHPSQPTLKYGLQKATEHIFIKKALRKPLRMKHQYLKITVVSVLCKKFRWIIRFPPKKILKNNEKILTLEVKCGESQ